MSDISRFPWKVRARSLIVVIAFFLTGCAGLKVGPVSSYAPNEALESPKTIAIVVENDSPPPTKEKRRAQQLADVRTASTTITSDMQKLLRMHQLIVVSPDQSADLILRCRILDLKGGSSALRIFVGYGAGKAVLRTGVSLIDSRTSERPTLLDFETDGTSGSMPPSVGAIGQGLPKEIDQTVENIDEQLNKYFTAQHWPYPGPAKTGG